MKALCFFGLLFLVFGRYWLLFSVPALDKEMRTRVLVVFGWLSIGFILFLLTTSNPFLRQFQVLNTQGRDLNPLLQDPGFLFHPPMLYMGYVGFSVAFAFAIAALWAGKVEASWSKWTRPWTLAAWCCLTAGITLGVGGLIVNWVGGDGGFGILLKTHHLCPG